MRMAQRGRKPKPTAIKELEGNPGKRPLNDAEPKPAKKAPPCPKWLEPEAKKEWRRLSKQLEQIGVLTEVDQAAFASYCQASEALKSSRTSHGRWQSTQIRWGFQTARTTGWSSIYEVLPQLFELWGMNLETQAESKKALARLTAK